EDTDGHLWVGYNGGLARLDGAAFHNFTPRDGLLGSDVVDLFPDPRGGVWIATDQGISRFDGQRFSNYPLPSMNLSLASLVTGSRTGTIYAGPSQGLQVFRPEMNHFEPSPLVQFPVQALHCDPEDDSLLLIDDHTLYRLSGGTLETLATSPLPDKLLNFSFGRNHTIWLHSAAAVWKHRPAADTVYSSAALGDPSITGVIEDRENNVWITRWGGGSVLLSDKILNITEDLPGKIVTQVARDRNGAIWVSGEHGIARLAPDGTPDISLSTPYVNALLVDGDRVWVGTHKGLWLYNIK